MIGVDARWLTGNSRGMGRFAQQLLAPVRDHALLLAQPGPSDGLTRFGSRVYPIWEQRSLPAAARRLGLSHLLCPYNTGPARLDRQIGLILVVHDLIFMAPLSQLPLSPSAYQNLGRLYRRAVVPLALRRADRIITVSDTSRTAIATGFGVAPDRITVIPNSLGAAWFDTPPATPEPGPPFLLTVSGEAPSKNLGRLLPAFAALCGNAAMPPDLRLAIAGVSPAGRAAFAGQASRLGIADRLDWQDFLPEPALRALYDRALGLVFPSLSEGFGIPLIEAMARGCPVACSDIPISHEVCGPAARRFDPADVGAMAAAMAALVTRPDPAAVAAGRQRAATFATAAVAPRIAAFWDSVA